MGLCSRTLTSPGDQLAADRSRRVGAPEPLALTERNPSCLRPFSKTGPSADQAQEPYQAEKTMTKLVIAAITGVLFTVGAASAQMSAPSNPNAQNPEATCPAGANCAPGQASPGATGATQPRPTSSDVTGSTAQPSSEKKNPEHTCPPGSKC